MKAKHTPGPWTINDSMAKDGRKSCLWYYIYAEGKTVAEVKGRHCKIKNSTALSNAKLIAAAPELLEALSEFIDYYESDFFNFTANDGYVKADWVIKASKAIKKATS